MALVAAAGCSANDTTAPAREARGPLAGSAAARSAASEANDEGSPRSGDLLIAKECSQYTALAGSFCTITASNLRALPAGTRIVYEKGVAAGVLETDVTLYPPGNGRSVAFGHVSLNFARAYGTGTLTGGTGRFKHLAGSVEITPLPAVRSWQWAGTYSFGDDDGDD
jgi:hypothetical protein